MGISPANVQAERDACSDLMCSNKVGRRLAAAYPPELHHSLAVRHAGRNMRAHASQARLQPDSLLKSEGSDPAWWRLGSHHDCQRVGPTKQVAFKSQPFWQTQVTGRTVCTRKRARGSLGGMLNIQDAMDAEVMTPLGFTRHRLNPPGLSKEQCCTHV